MPRLDSLLAPRSVAVIGASPDPHKIRGALLHLLRKNGFTGRIVPVNPSYAEIAGIPCYPTIAAAGEPVDVALVAIPAAGVLAVLEECAAAGARNAVIISSGFAEDEAAPGDLQDQVAALARRTGMRVAGPNAEGFYNEVARVTATFSPAVDRDADEHPTALHARIGIVAQSGGMGFALYNRGRALGLSFSTVVSTGNEADLTLADFVAHMVEDPDTSAILLFLESIRDPSGFIAAAVAAREAGKPIVAIKIGYSPVGKLAAASHTASMAGWNTGYEAMFHRYGIAVATELEEALAIAAAMAANPPARGRRVAVVTVSGGAGAWSADALEAAGLELPELSAATQAEIRGYIPSYGASRNPVDLTAQGAQGGGILRTVELLSHDPDIDQIAIVTSLANPARVSIDGPGLATLLAQRRKPVLFYSYTLPSPLGRRILAEAGAIVCPSMQALAAAARALADQSRKPSPAGGRGRGEGGPAAGDLPDIRPSSSGQRHPHPDPLPPAGEGDDTASGENIPFTVLARLAYPAGSMAEHAVKALLVECGAAIAPGRLVRDAQLLEQLGAEVGFPLAVKIQSPAIAHKTEVDGVRLGIGDHAALVEAYATVLANAARHAPGARIEGVLLEPMAAKGVEIIVGIVRDPTFGPVVTVGAGGTTTELFQDTVHRLAPVDEAEATAMLRALRSAPLLEGFRGAPAADLPALARLVALVSRLADAGRNSIAELELNPVIVHPAGQGCTIADALLVLSPAGQTGG